MPVPRVTVLLPTFGQAAFVRRALDSLAAQTFGDWEAWVVVDGSPDDTESIVRPRLRDARFRLLTLPRNVGLGAALNRGLEASDAPLVAYLPTDDVWHANHLATLVARLDEAPDAVLAWAGLRHHYNRLDLDPLPPPDGLQLVQVLHRRTGDRWLERTELVTDDLERMYWARLRRHGRFLGTGAVTCEWVDHPLQRSKVIREPTGGINPYRQRYGVRHPLRFATTAGDAIDEVERYRRFRERPDTPPAADRLRILLVGELSYNPERVLALEERGHRLYGLWTPDPYWYNAVGPQPFGHVIEVATEDPAEAVREVRPDVIYALLNWQAVPFAARVRRAAGDVPFVWHFKEGPFICLEKGSWADLVELTAASDGVIHSSPEMREWFATVIPEAADPDRNLVLDGDLPKADWFEADFSPRLSDQDGEVHTVVPGRPIGLHPETVADLGAAGIHLHFYGDFTQGQWREWVARARSLAPNHLHLHPTVDQRGWVDEFSRYDAGWLHVFESRNRGDLRAANWDDLNIPARVATLAAAGLPMLYRPSPGSVVAVQSLVEERAIGIPFHDGADLGVRLRAEIAGRIVRERVVANREAFTFDHHADRLVAFLRAAAGRNRVRRAARTTTPPTMVRELQRDGRVVDSGPVAPPRSVGA